MTVDESVIPIGESFILLGEHIIAGTIIPMSIELNRNYKTGIYTLTATYTNTEEERDIQEALANDF